MKNVESNEDNNTDLFPIKSLSVSLLKKYIREKKGNIGKKLKSELQHELIKLVGSDFIQIPKSSFINLSDQTKELDSINDQIKQLSLRKQELLMQTTLTREQKRVQRNNDDLKERRLEQKMNNKRKRNERRQQKLNDANPKIKKLLLAGHRNTSIHDLLKEEKIDLDNQIISNVAKTLTFDERRIMDLNKKKKKDIRKKENLIENEKKVQECKEKNPDYTQIQIANATGVGIFTVNATCKKMKTSKNS